MLLTGLTAKQLSWGDVRLTYRDFLDKIDSVASVLLSKGVNNPPLIEEGACKSLS